MKFELKGPWFTPLKTTEGVLFGGKKARMQAPLHPNAFWSHVILVATKIGIASSWGQDQHIKSSHWPAQSISPQLLQLLGFVKPDRNQPRHNKVSYTERSKLRMLLKCWWRWCSWSIESNACTWSSLTTSSPPNRKIAKSRADWATGKKEGCTFHGSSSRPHRPIISQTLTLTLFVVHTGRELQDLFFNLHGGHFGGLRRGIRPECLGGWKCQKSWLVFPSHDDICQLCTTTLLMLCRAGCSERLLWMLIPRCHMTLRYRSPTHAVSFDVTVGGSRVVEPPFVVDVLDASPEDEQGDNPGAQHD